MGAGVDSDRKASLIVIGSITAVTLIGFTFESLTGLRFVHWLAYGMFVIGALFAGHNMWFADNYDRSMETYNWEIRDAASRGDVEEVKKISQQIRQDVRFVSKSGVWAGGLMFLSALLLQGSDWVR